MARLARLLVAVLFPAVLLGGAGLAGAGSAVAAPLALNQCTTTSGVILAVDFGSFGGGVYRACGSTPTTGLALLQQGGWSYGYTQHDGPAFVCRIGYAGFNGGTQYPTPATEKCVSTPSASHYWSYWHANPGDTAWTYSTSGAATYQPKPGSVDAWVYGGTDVAGTSGAPSFSPDSVRAHNTTAPGGGSGGAGSGGSGGGSGSGNGGSGTGGSGGSAGGSGATGTSGSGTSGTGTSGAGTGGGSGSAGTGNSNSSGSAGGSDRQPSPDNRGSGPAGSHSAAAGRTSPIPATKPSNTPASPSLAGSTSAPAVVDAQPVAAARHSSGSLVPVLITAAIIVVIAGLIGARLWTRKQANQQL